MELFDMLAGIVFLLIGGFTGWISAGTGYSKKTMPKNISDEMKQLINL